jgi:hypothetical protein
MFGPIFIILLSVVRGSDVGHIPTPTQIIYYGLKSWMEETPEMQVKTSEENSTKHACTGKYKYL